MAIKKYIANADNRIKYHENGAGVACFIKYTLYDGPDALIANKLLELGVTINPNNVDWYKRSLIEQQQRSRVAAAAGGQA